MDEAEFLIQVLIELAPNLWEDVLLRLDSVLPEEGLSSCLRQGGRHRRMAALVVHSAHLRTSQFGDVARRLRKRFPKSSIPMSK